MAYDDLFALLSSCEKSLFRLEGLPKYGIPQEEEDFLSWQQGNPPPEHVKNTRMQAMSRDLRSKGCSVQRVRVLETPITDYIKFETEWWYPFNTAAGEDMFALDVQKNTLDLSLGEFYRVDDKIIRLYYKEDYSYEGWDIAPNSDFDAYKKLEEEALTCSEPFFETYERLVAQT
jgi:hypothetical protein